MNSKVLIVFLISCFAGALCNELCIDSCPLNEVFSECKGAGICQKTCSTRNTIIGECDCVSGCICKTGYIRDANTYKCIKKSSCPPINNTTCAKNEVYSKSEAGCQKNCLTQNMQVRCAPKSGCICKTGYFRCPITNQCLLKSSCEKCPSGHYRNKETGRYELDCDICMDFNAEFKKCGDRCRELTCENPSFEGIKCPEDFQCEPGCFCKAGYIKDPKTKLCIRPNSCPNACKDPNAVYSNCGTNKTCDMKTCRFPNGKGQMCMKVCEKGCFCKPGYVKNDSGKCVLLKNCPIPKCKKNEIFQCRNPSCEPGCIIEPCKSVYCENKCYCKDGYVKQNGTCILLEACQKCDDPNAEYNNCRTQCTKATCLNPTGISLFCKGIFCNAGCFCKGDYVLDHTGKCILLENCPKCPENESFNCRSAACEKNCGNLNETCTIWNDKCDNKCFCNKGFVRETPNGPCIPISKCPPNDCKINEVLECRKPTCDDEGCCIEKERPCKDVPCVNKCYCAHGFVRIDGVCVTRDKCFKAECPANETMGCRDAACNDEVCLLKSIPCLGGDCVERCYCDKGFARINGVCVPRENCQIYCKDPNSTYNYCAPFCESSCNHRFIGDYCWDECVEDCFCNSGFIKDATMICIPIDQCPISTCTDPNSEFSCQNPYCEPSCRTLDQTCDVIYPYCDKRCYCKSGYVVSDSGICIPIEQCPQTKKCPANEISSCRNPTCVNEGCDDEELFPCLDAPCEIKCFCASGFVRINGECVSREQCKKPVIIVDPIVECVPNAKYSTCGSSCAEPTCDNPTKADVACPYLCEQGCFCQQGYLKNYAGLCVLPENCPTACPANEFFSCGSAGCEENCDNLGEKCTIVNITCDKKCFCNDGYVRQYRNGPCIIRDQCPRIIVDPPMYIAATQ